MLKHHIVVSANIELVFCAFGGNNELHIQVETRETVLMELWAEF